MYVQLLASKQLSVLLRQVRDHVALFESENTLFRFRRILQQPNQTYISDVSKS